MTEFIEFPALTFWKTVNTFSEIPIKPNTLVLCDIDETLLHHPAINNDWVDMIQRLFLLRNHSATGIYDAAKAEEDTNKYCNVLFERIPMRHTDREGFFAMVAMAEGFAFVTARQEFARQFTYDNLRSLGIDPSGHEVHFSSNMPKGEYILANFDLSKYNYVVFIDDQAGNLQNVLANVNHEGLELYQFQHRIGMLPHDYYPVPLEFNIGQLDNQT
jgi:hypothetical protein